MDFGYIIPDNGKAIYSVMCPNADTGKQGEISFRSGGKTDFIRMDEVAMQFIYTEGDFLVCMNQESHEQLYISKILLFDSIQFLKEGMVLKILIDDKEKPLKGKLPKYLELGLAYAEDGNSAKPPHLRRNLRGQNFNTKTTVKGL